MKKRRTYEDFRELGAYLYVVHYALVKSQVKASPMYRKDSPKMKKLEKLEKALQDVRLHLDERWVHDLTEGSIVGPETIYAHEGSRPQFARQIIDILRGIGRRGKLAAIQGGRDKEGA